MVWFRRIGLWWLFVSTAPRWWQVRCYDELSWSAAPVLVINTTRWPTVVVSIEAPPRFYEPQRLGVTTFKATFVLQVGPITIVKTLPRLED